MKITYWQVYEEGKDACWKGESKNEDNPYWDYSPAWRDWRAGFDFAKQRHLDSWRAPVPGDKEQR